MTILTSTRAAVLGLSFPVLMFGAGIVAMLAILDTPSPYDRAVIIRICRDGSRIFRMENGEYRALRGGALHGYRVENPETVCAP